MPDTASRVRPIPPGWRERRERGTRFGLLCGRRFALRCGRRTSRLLLGFVVAWYLLRARSEQRHLRDFLNRALDRPCRWNDISRIYWNFACVTLDRVFLLAGRDRQFDIRVQGGEIFSRLQDEGRGAILLGAHFGSFEALRTLGMRRAGLPISILQYVEQNPLITRELARIDPDLARCIIPLGRPDVLLRLADRLRQGEFVALLGDRIGAREERSVSCDFLGAPARFPSGGIEAALMLGAPVILFLGIYRGGRRYELHFELLEAGQRIPRSRRREATQRLVCRYAQRLAHYARQTPWNWFNFFDFWEPAAGNSGKNIDSSTALQ